ncbi:MAG TPA: hypothetical protein VM661_03925 [Candidatus Sulfotelmatobacter sp.]|nr:hypothetical protein [Candidatus Sulfotelmatobacter sp.]
MSKKDVVITWLPQPEEHDYPAAASYLGLIYPPVLVDKIVRELREASVSQFKAKDIFRASGLSLLGVSNGHVKKDQDKILAGTPLSPLLLLRDNQLGKVVIADGYHRMCAIYSFDEDALIHCKIV